MMKRQVKLAQQFRELYGRYKKHEDMINLGVYQLGTDESIDQAIEYYPKLMNFLKQNMKEPFDYASSLQEMSHSLEPNA